MQTLLDKNFFDIFGLNEAFGLDQSGLRERFRTMQRKYHPDNYATASEAEKRISAQYAAHINEAFTTLKDPVLRARYILSQHGVRLHEKSHMDASFLMEQMELRDDLEAAKSSDSGITGLMKLSDKVNRDFNSRTSDLDKVLADPASADLVDAERLVRELQFYDRIRHEIEEAEEAWL